MCTFLYYYAILLHIILNMAILYVESLYIYITIIINNVLLYNKWIYIHISLTSIGDSLKIFKTLAAVLKEIPLVSEETPSFIWKEEIVGLGSKRFGWLHTFRSCIRMLITDMKWPDARVSFVLKDQRRQISIISWVIITINDNCYNNNMVIIW